MTEVTSEYLTINSVADVEAIEDSTNNRMAVRSLRHAARRAAHGIRHDESADQPSLRTVVHQLEELTSMGCTGVETRDQWIERLGQAVEQADDHAASVKAAAQRTIDRTDDAVELYKASLKKALSILAAHPEGLPEPSSAAVDADEDYEEDDE